MQTYIHTKRIGGYKIIECLKGYLYYELQLGPLVFQVARRKFADDEPGRPAARVKVWIDSMWRR